MSVEPKTLVVEASPDPETFVKAAMRVAGVTERDLPSAFPEGSRIHVGSSSVHHVSRPAVHVEPGEKGSPKFNVEPPRSIIATGAEEREAWTNYAGLIANREGSSCLRLQTPEGPQFVRFQVAAAMPA